MRWKKWAVIGLAAVEAFVFNITAYAEANFEGNGYYLAAYKAYNRAKKAANFKESTDAYAEAISCVSRAVEENPDNFDYLVLASLIYRGKGGAAYAQNYFLRAENIINERVKENPTDIESRINRAILYYAGDGQFSDKAYKYSKEALKEANVIVNLCQQALKKDKNTPNISRALAFAYLMKGNKRECERFLEASSTENDKNKLIADLYENTVKKNKWLWNVKEVEKEFLLYAIMLH